MLSPEMQKQRGSHITASEAVSIMANIDDLPPNTGMEGYQTLFDAMKGRDWKGDSKVGTVKSRCPGVEIVNAKLIAEVLKGLKQGKLPDGLVSYAHQLARQELYPNAQRSNWQSEDMERGDEREPEAIRLLGEKAGVVYEHTVSLPGGQIHVTREVDGMKIGATPDGIEYSDLMAFKSGGEVKCRNPEHHDRQMMLKGPDELRRKFHGAYCQCQVGMLCLDIPVWRIGWYNPDAIPDLQFGWMLIERDEKYLDKFLERAAICYEQKEIYKQRLLERAA